MGGEGAPESFSEEASGPCAGLVRETDRSNHPAPIFHSLQLLALLHFLSSRSTLTLLIFHCHLS